MKNYRLTHEELAEIIEASKPVPYMVIGGVEPQSPRDKVMAIWRRVAERVGCDVDSIDKGTTGDLHDFIARPIAVDAKEQLAKDLTKKFADDGWLIEAGFAAFRSLVIHEDAPRSQVAEMRMAFMAGAQHLFGSMMATMDPGAEPTEDDLRRMDLIHAELEAFTQEMKLHIAGKG